MYRFLYSFLHFFFFFLYSFLYRFSLRELWLFECRGRDVFKDRCSFFFYTWRDRFGCWRSFSYWRSIGKTLNSGTDAVDGSFGLIFFADIKAQPTRNRVYPRRVERYAASIDCRYEVNSRLLNGRQGGFYWGRFYGWRGFHNGCRLYGWCSSPGRGRRARSKLCLNRVYIVRHILLEFEVKLRLATTCTC